LTMPMDDLHETIALATDALGDALALAIAHKFPSSITGRIIEIANECQQLKRRLLVAKSNERGNLQ
jgi:hypothetical protein